MMIVAQRKAKQPYLLW